MSRPIPVQYDEASPEVRAVYDDIKITRKMSDVPNFWKYLATNPALLKRTWETQKQTLAPGALDVLTKELIYLAVSVTNGCSYGVAAHTTIAQKAGMTDEMFGEVMAVVGMANQTNRFAHGYRLPIDPIFDQ